jgi:hypothetical protein
MIRWIKSLPIRIWRGLLHIWRGICWLGRTIRSPGPFLENHQTGLQNCGLTISGIAGGGFFAILLSAQPTWPWHVLLLLLGSVALAVAFFVGAAVGARRTKRQPTPGEVIDAVNAAVGQVLGEVRELRSELTGAKVTHPGPAASASVGATGPAGPVLGANVFAYENYDDLAKGSGGSGLGARSAGPTGATGPGGAYPTTGG